MIPASLSLAKSDPRLRGAPLAVYVWCLEHLDTHEYRPIKVLALTTSLRIKRTTASFALARLREAGYLSRGEREFRGPWQFRLYAAPAAPVKARAA